MVLLTTRALIRSAHLTRTEREERKAVYYVWWSRVDEQ